MNQNLLFLSNIACLWTNENKRNILIKKDRPRHHSLGDKGNTDTNYEMKPKRRPLPSTDMYYLIFHKFGPFDFSNASKKNDTKSALCRHPLCDKNDAVDNNYETFVTQLM